MIIAVPKEITPFETRVAATPNIVKKYISMGLSVHIESGAGVASGFSDDEYKSAGAEIKKSASEVYKQASIIIKIKAPLPSEYKFLQPNQIIIADFDALNNLKQLKELTLSGLTAFALDLMPRISRAQSMDILSSQNSLAGYRAVIKAVEMSSKAAPMMMTAAGTIPPIKVLVLGAGVAGLQAIATAKRLGAQVFASDVRPAVKEQVESLGAQFLEIKSEENFEASTGYAKQTSKEYQKLQQEAILSQLPKTDIVITTALIPGKKAPRLISSQMLKSMPSGGVIIDMAAANGGNVEGSKDHATINTNGITICGNSNLAAEIPHSASFLFAQNIYNFLSFQFNKNKADFVFDFTDEIIAKTCITQQGE